MAASVSTESNISHSPDHTLVDESPQEPQDRSPPDNKAVERIITPTPDPVEPAVEVPIQRFLRPLRIPIVAWTVEPPKVLVSTLERTQAKRPTSLIDLAFRLGKLPVDVALATLPVASPSARFDGRPIRVGVKDGAGLVVAGYWTVAGWFVGV